MPTYTILKSLVVFAIIPTSSSCGGLTGISGGNSWCDAQRTTLGIMQQRATQIAYKSLDPVMFYVTWYP